MKNILLGSALMGLFSISVIISCQKQSTAQRPADNCIDVQPRFQFKANGISYVCDASFDKNIGWIGTPNIYASAKYPGSYELNGKTTNYGYSTTEGCNVYFKFQAGTLLAAGTFNHSGSLDCTFNDNWYNTR